MAQMPAPHFCGSLISSAAGRTLPKPDLGGKEFVVEPTEVAVTELMPAREATHDCEEHLVQQGHGGCYD
jgi:hypothetical protein